MASTDTLFARVLLPVADQEDAGTTGRAVKPYLDRAGGTAVAVHVIEKADGAPDKASVEQREEMAESVFEATEDALTGLDVDTRIAYGPDIAEAIFDVANDIDATAIVFTPRAGGRWVRLLTGDTALSLITETDRPVIVLPGSPTPEE